MEHIQKAIQLAVQGGYLKNSTEIYKGQVYTFGEKIVNEKVFLDPLFWSSLGKSLSWGDENGIDDRTFWIGTIDYPEISDEGQAFREIWRFKMHQFIDHLAEGKLADDFFKVLLN